MPVKLTVYRSWLTTCLLLFATIAFAQRTVTGRITSSNNQPVIGATVAVKGTNLATSTGADGSFSINVPSNSNTLVITSIGFADQEVTIGSGPVNVSLTESSTSMNEIIVTGYSSQRKKDITGSVAVVDVQNMKQVPSGTVESLLQGQAAGVTIVNNGQPGAGSNIRIRGITSVGSVDPLVIVDGTPGSMHDLNVNDIESIQVLKDAGAAAIYGVRGSNGVIVITTKKGRQGKVRVTYDGYYGTQRPLKDGFNIANTEETARAVFEGYANSGISPNHKQYGNGATPVIPDYITPFGTMEGGPNTDPSTYALYTNQITRANKQGTDWFHEIFKPASIQSHSISASGGSDKSTYYMSIGYLNQNGTLLNTYLKRYTARINTMFNVHDKIRIGENAFIFHRDNPQIGNQNEGNAISHSYRQNVIIPVYDIMGNFAGTGSQNLGNAQNPVANLSRMKDNKGNNWQINGNIFAEVDILPFLTVRSQFGGTIDNFYYYNFSYTAYENAENNRNPNGFTEGSGFNTSKTWTNTATFNKAFGNHAVKVVAGSEAISSSGRSMAAGRNNYYVTDPSRLLIDPNLWTLNFGSPTTMTNSGGPYRNSLFSLFGRVDYNFDDKYLLSGTLRRDGSSVFFTDNQYGTFPSVTAGWRISRESFMSGITWLNDLKLRGGWGKLGSISNINSTNPYSLYGQSAANSFYDINGVNNSSTQGFYASQLGNEQTTWEEDIITNVGFDAAILNNRLEFSLEWYKKAISGLLFRASASDFLGQVTQPFKNSGNIENTGIDAALTYRGKITTDLSFDVTGTFTSYNNKVVSLPPGIAYYDRGSGGSGRIGAFSRMQAGQALGAFFGYEVIGLFQSADDVTKSPTQQDAAPGRLKYRDVNNDGAITVADRTFFGNPNPDFTAGLNLSASWKNFDLSTFFYASVGNDVLNYVRYWTDFPQVFDGAVSKDAVYNSWRPDRPNAKVPRLERSANFSNTTQVTSYMMEDGSFLRCKSLMLGFTVPAKAVQRFNVDRFRIYAQAVNLFTLTKYTGLDPELQTSNFGDNSNFGIDFGNYPANQRMFTVGVNLSF